MYIYEYYERELRIIVTTTLRQLSGNQKKKNFDFHGFFLSFLCHIFLFLKSNEAKLERRVQFDLNVESIAV